MCIYNVCIFWWITVLFSPYFNIFRQYKRVKYELLWNTRSGVAMRGRRFATLMMYRKRTLQTNARLFIDSSAFNLVIFILKINPWSPENYRQQRQIKADFEGVIDINKDNICLFAWNGQNKKLDKKSVPHTETNMSWRFLTDAGMKRLWTTMSLTMKIRLLCPFCLRHTGLHYKSYYNSFFFFSLFLKTLPLL